MATANSVLYFERFDVSSGVSSVSVQIPILNLSGIPSNYQLAYGTWSPRVAHRKRNLLSGSISYEPVEEEMTLNILGATAAAATANLQALATMLDQADRWSDNQVVTPVRIWYQPKGSNAALVYNTLVLSNRSSDDWLDLPVTFDEVGQIYRINGVTVKFLRAGAWLQSNTANTANTGTVSCGAVGSLTLPGPNSDLPSPCDVTFGTFDTTAIPQPVPASILILANRNKQSGLRNLIAVDSDGFVTAGKYTSVNDSAKNAIGNTICRYTPTDTAYNESAYTIPGTNIAGQVLAIYATIRNNSTTTTFKIKVTCAAQSGATSASVTRGITQETYIDASIQTPRVVFLGTLTRPTSPAGNTPAFNVTIQASAASGSLDIDNMIVVAIDDETVSILEIPTLNFTIENTAGTHTVGFYSNQGFNAYGNPLRGFIPTRAIATMSTTILLNIAVVGLMPFMALDSHVEMVWLCVAAAAADRWVYVNNSNNPLTPTLTISERHSAYLIPE